MLIASPFNATEAQEKGMCVSIDKFLELTHDLFISFTHTHSHGLAVFQSHLRVYLLQSDL